MGCNRGDNRRTLAATRYDGDMTDDLSRQGATTPDSEYTLTIDEALERYDHAGHPRTARSVQRYCAKGHLDCRRIETPVRRKISDLASLSRQAHRLYRGGFDRPRQVTTCRDLSRQMPTLKLATTGSDNQRRQVPTCRDKTRHMSPPEMETSPTDSRDRQATDKPRHVATGPDLTERYIDRLEGEVTFLREELTTKNAQIKELTERSRETNVLIGGLQRLLAPMLGSPDPHRPTSDETPRPEHGQ